MQSVVCPSTKKLVTKATDITNCFNGYFSTIGANLSTTITATNPISPLQIYTSSNLSSLFLNPICPDDVIRQIDLLDNNKCDDTYEIPINVIKLSKNLIAPILSNLFNQCSIIVIVIENILAIFNYKIAVAALHKKVGGHGHGLPLILNKLR